MADDKTDADKQRGKTGSDKPGPSTAETQKELLAGIKDTLVEQSATLGSSLGRDTINVRRHLLEMKKMTGEQLDNQKALNKTFGIQLDQDTKSLEGESVEKMDDQESQDDMKTIFEDIRNTLQSLPTSLGAEGAKQSGMMATGMLGGFGKMFAKTGAAIGIAGVGIGALVGAGAYLLNTLDKIDGKKIADNVKELLSISDEFVDEEGGGGMLRLLGESGVFYLSMLGIGLGLAALSLGTGAAMAVEKFGTGGTEWIDNIKTNVVQLLSIKDDVGGNLKFLTDSAFFGAAMGGIGLGLAAFALGKGVAGAAEGWTGVVEKFSKGDDWAKNIKEEVTTLLSIKDELGGNVEMLKDGGAFVLTMTGLMAGLAAFALGKGVAGVGEAAVGTLTYFTKGGDWAQDIKNEVETLLSIGNLEGATLEQTTATMGILGALGVGLIAFGAGKGVAGIGEILTRFSGAGKNFATDIKNEVETLLSIGSLPQATLEDTTRTMGILGALGTGLASFGVGTFVGALGQAGKALVNFFSGEDGPVTQALTLADNSDRIDKGVDSLRSFKGILNEFQDIGDITFDLNTEAMAEELLGATKVFETALEGGEIPEWGFNTKVKGLLNIEGIDTVTEEINLLKSLFAPVNTTGLELNTVGNPLLLGAGAGGGSIVDASSTQQAYTSHHNTNNIYALGAPVSEVVKEIKIG